MLVLNELHALPWRNLKATYDEAVHGITGERFAEELLLRKNACSGCPVGCIHVGLLREKFADQNEFVYRQVSYDHEPIFAAGSMLGVTHAGNVLMLLEEMERQGLDVISAAVALAWATEAFERGLVTEKETLVPLEFGRVENYRNAVRHLGMRMNEFYEALGQGTAVAAARYGGEEFACVLGQEMAGYATGEVFFVSQAYGFRHSHLDSAGYGFDQKAHDKDTDVAVAYLIEEERRRVQLTCMVSCLFARSVYSEERLQDALAALGYPGVAEALAPQSRVVQATRWKLKFVTGYNPQSITIPRRFREVQTWKGALDETFLEALSEGYKNSIMELGDRSEQVARQ
jgi:aldehyde:ferredoxin oxidoreductase